MKKNKYYLVIKKGVRNEVQIIIFYLYYLFIIITVERVKIQIIVISLFYQ